MTVETIQQTATGIEIELSLILGMAKVERRKPQRSGTGQRNFDKNGFCNYCDITGHTTHRCFKLVDYLKRKGKKIISHDEEEVQELAQAVQNLNLKLNSLKIRTSTNY